MEQPRLFRPFFYKVTHEKMAEILNEKYPINIKNNQDLVNRVSARYPLATKSDVALVVMTFFKTIRDLIVSGHIISFKELFYNVYACFSYNPNFKSKTPHLRLRVCTPVELKERFNKTDG